MSKKTKGQELSEKLTYHPKNTFDTKNADKATVNAYCEDYKKFLNKGKTEREVVTAAIEMIKEKGYTEYKLGDKLVPGGKYYLNNRGKSMFMFRLGTEDINNGIRITASHIDSPRVDFKPRPLYEDSEMCFFKTHYYGGIKKYQWVAMPLSLHGVICKPDGDVAVCVGEEESDPVFYINDVAPHIGQLQAQKHSNETIAGEQLNVLCGTEPYDDEKASDKVKLFVLNALHEKYGCTEADLVSSELCAVPAMKARDIGFDRSLIGSYGHDDRVCAYPSLTALMAVKDPKHTIMAVLADKEEVGSEGNTGMQSILYIDIITDLARTFGVSDIVVRSNSKCLSSDVNAAFDPNFPEVSEKRNSCFVNNGVVITKYTGAKGKSGTNDSSAEFAGYVRNLLDAEGVIWQTSELGKIDQGGGGTVAKYIAKYNIDVIDLGVPVLSMHAPYEVVSKTDVYMVHKALVAFFCA